MKGEWAKLVLAAQFLTRLPLRTDRLFSAGRMADAPRYFPLVGLLIGVASAGAYWLAALALPHLVAVIVAICAGLLLTGAFHEDGLADTFDGIGGGLNRDQSLEIMKDSRLGTYGTAALVGALALKAAALAAMPPFWVIASLPLAHCTSRLSAVLVIATSRYVREEGTGKPVSQGLSSASLGVASVIGVGAVSISLIWCQPIALVSGLALMGVMHVAMRLMFEPKLGGYTGDTLGAMQQASEIGFYLGVLAWL